MRAETKQWLEIAEGDYDSGVWLLQRRRYPQVIYLLCQAIEKVLKAAQIEFAQQIPQKVHHLDLLAKQTGLPFSQEQYTFLKKLTKLYQQVRYPDIAQSRYNTKAKTEDIISESQIIYQWIYKQFKRH